VSPSPIKERGRNKKEGLEPLLNAPREKNKPKEETLYSFWGVGYIFTG
jgi:hypothetical protein